MQPPDLDFAAACTAAEGWASETREEFESFMAHDPAECLVAEADGERIGICVATPYGSSGFVGELIVVPGWRGQGVGRQLLERAIAYLRGQGARNIFLDGVVAAVSLYERAGFDKLCRSLRFSGKIAGRSYPHVRPMRPEHLPTVRQLDRRAFGADRRYFLERRLACYPELCWILEQGGQVAGFILGRRGPGLISAGPWVVWPGVERPESMLESLATEAGGSPLALGVLETNTQAVTLIRSLGLTEHPAPPWRMRLGSTGNLGDSDQCYAVGSPAKG